MGLAGALKSTEIPSRGHGKIGLREDALFAVVFWRQSRRGEVVSSDVRAYMAGWIGLSHPPEKREF